MATKKRSKSLVKSAAAEIRKIELEELRRAIFEREKLVMQLNEHIRRVPPKAASDLRKQRDRLAREAQRMALVLRQKMK